MALERQDDDENNPWWGEHVHRYIEASGLIRKGSKVLDLACGNGFGSQLLAQAGNTVTGGDISAAAVEECKKKYAFENPAFLQLDGSNLPFGDESFDYVVSFETLEHTRDFEKMLSEFRRILKPGGSLILSTPNFPVNSPSGKVENPYHTQEWDYEGLGNLIGRFFPASKISGQHYARYDRDRLSDRAGRAVENFLYRKGVRKTPLFIQDGIMRLFTGKKMYPSADDFIMVSAVNEIKKCKTFFAVCPK